MRSQCGAVSLGLANTQSSCLAAGPFPFSCVYVAYEMSTLPNGLNLTTPESCRPVSCGDITLSNPTSEADCVGRVGCNYTVPYAAVYPAPARCEDRYYTAIGDASSRAQCELLPVSVIANGPEVRGTAISLATYLGCMLTHLAVAGYTSPIGMYANWECLHPCRY